MFSWCRLFTILTVVSIVSILKSNSAASIYGQNTLLFFSKKRRTLVIRVHFLYMGYNAACLLNRLIWRRTVCKGICIGLQGWKALRNNAYSNILKISPAKTGRSDKNSDIFQISTQNIDCGYSLEPPRRGGSNEYPQSIFLAEITQIMYTPVNPSFII